MFVTIINDCRDADAISRISTRCSVLFNCTVNTVGVENYNELEAAGILIDTLDASEGKQGVVLVNSAPRHKNQNKNSNGSKFGYFWYQDTLVVSTIDEYTLSLVKKLKLTDQIHVLHIPQVLDYAVEHGLLKSELKEHIINTQFRSFDFQPRAAKWIFDKIDLPSEALPINEIPDAPTAIWYFDNFGNAKTTLLNNEISSIGLLQVAYMKPQQLSQLPYYPHLKDVPQGQCAIITGSSGIGDKRFLEIVVQGGRAEDKLKVKSEKL